MKAYFIDTDRAQRCTTLFEFDIVRETKARYYKNYDNGIAIYTTLRVKNQRCYGKYIAKDGWCFANLDDAIIKYRALVKATLEAARENVQRLESCLAEVS